MILLAFLLSLLAVSLAEVCPDPGDLGPCTCSVMAGWSLRVRCMGGEMDNLIRPLGLLREKMVHNLEFVNVKFGRVPVSFFQELSVDFLIFEDCEITELVDSASALAFAGLEDSLTKIRLENSIRSDGQMKPLALGHLKKMFGIEISKSPITELDAEWFAAIPPDLKLLSLKENGIESIESNALAGFRNLMWVYLSGQKITSFTRDILPVPASKLVFLDLSDCQLTSLPEDMFADMPELNFVSISGNKIQKLLSSTWSPIWSQIGFLEADENPLECDEHIEWMFPMTMPEVLFASCAGPASRLGQQLKEVIESNIQQASP